MIIAVLDIRDAATPGEQATAADRLAAALHGPRLLLVLGNCGHLVEQVAGLAGRLLRSGPGLRILSTSREPLGLDNEAVWDVRSPPRGAGPIAGSHPECLERSSAVRLFVARATAAARDITLDADTGPAVAPLFRRLDGIPSRWSLRPVGCGCSAWMGWWPGSTIGSACSRRGAGTQTHSPRMLRPARPGANAGATRGRASALPLKVIATAPGHLL
jgi:hypothetical protein